MICVAAAGYAFLWQGLRIFQAVKDYEPLILPLGVTALSVLPRATELKSLESILKLSNDVAIGIISFDIWALSASRGHPKGNVLISDSKMISGDYVIGLLILGLLVAFSCAVLTNFAHSLSPKLRQRWLVSALFASILIYIAPWGIIEKVPPPDPPANPTVAIQQFVVAIPYQDPALVDIAPAYLRDRLLVHIQENVSATDANDAKAKALSAFMNSDSSKPLTTKRRQQANDDPVQIKQDLVVVGARPEN